MSEIEEHIEEPSLRESLSAAFAEDADAPAIETKQREDRQTEARPRAADGKFAPKTENTEQPLGAGAEVQAQAEPIRPPASWSAVAKAKFATLDPVVQAEISKREGDVAKGFTDKGKELERYKPLDAVLAPHRERIALNGQDEASYVRALVTADEILRGPNKVAGLQRLAQIYGIPFPQAGQGQQPAQQQTHPAIARMEQELQTLRQTVHQRQQHEAAIAEQQVQSQIQAFEADPKNIYFANVKADMGDLIYSGKAKTLEEAYDMACHMRPDIRALVANQPAQTSDAGRQRTQAARQAAGSVTGAPGPGSSAQAAPSNASLRDQLKEAFRASA